MIDYFDASVVVPFLMIEPHSRAVIDFMAEAPRPQVSDFVVAEVSSAVSAADAALHDLDDWIAATAAPIPIEGSDVREATTLVRQFDLKLRAPDALHIATCRRIDARLITLDINMAAAARALDLSCINPAEGLAA